MELPFFWEWDMIRETGKCYIGTGKKEEKSMNRKCFWILLVLTLFLGGCTFQNDEGLSSIPETESEIQSKAESDECIGQWEMTGASKNGLGITLETVQEKLGGSISFTLKKDGSFYAQFKNASVDGLWYQKENKIQLIMSNGETVDIEAGEHVLTMEWEGMTLIFEREQDV